MSTSFSSFHWVFSVGISNNIQLFEASDKIPDKFFINVWYIGHCADGGNQINLKGGVFFDALNGVVCFRIFQSDSLS